jgi:uncharacterized membrane protein YccF (DUF307 family)
VDTENGAKLRAQPQKKQPPEARAGQARDIPTRTGAVRVLLNAFWLVLCATIIGIPLGLANFKLIRVVIAPLGKDIVSADDARVVAGGVRF